MESLKDVASYDDLTHKQWIALGTKIGGIEIVKKVLADELEVNIGEAFKTLVDKNGRVIPMKGIKAAVHDSNRDFFLRQPSRDFMGRRSRFYDYFTTARISPDQFRSVTTELVEQIQEDTQLGNLLNGVCLPIILPRLSYGFGYGEYLDEVCLKAVAVAYQVAFPGRKFAKLSVGILANLVGIIEGSGQYELMARLNLGVTVGLYFPNPLQGFSILAAREQMSVLRAKGLILAAGIETAVALVMYPDIMAGYSKVPRYDLAGLFHQHPDCTLYFNKFDDELQLLDYELTDHADNCASAGLLYIGR